LERLDSLEVWILRDPPTPYHLQALTESLAGLGALGRIAGVALVYSTWRWDGYVAGLYEDVKRALVRRITGGTGIDMSPGGTYISAVRSLKSIEEGMKYVADTLRCLSLDGREGRVVDNGKVIGVYGVTRLGRPEEEASSVIELYVTGESALGTWSPA